MRLPPMLALLVLANAWAGCLGTPGTSMPEVAGSFAAPVETGPSDSSVRIHRPAWREGQWWQGRLAIDLGWGEPLAAEGRVVAVRNGTGWNMGAAERELGVLDAYFDSVFLGPVDADLNPIVAGEPIELYRWPLEPNATWRTTFVLPDGRGGVARRWPAEMTVTTFEDPGPFAPRLRVVAQLPGSITLDYDLSARSGWMSYLRLTNQSSGEVLVSADFRASGHGHAGDVHVVRREVVFERFAFSLPCEEHGACGPEAITSPSIDRFAVRGDFDFVEEIHFLFSFGFEGVGGGVASVASLRPDGSVRNTTHVGEPEPFRFRFRREAASDGFAGEWTTGCQAQGLAGAFLGVYGFHDRVDRARYD